MRPGWIVKQTATMLSSGAVQEDREAAGPRPEGEAGGSSETGGTRTHTLNLKGGGTRRPTHRNPSTHQVRMPNTGVDPDRMTTLLLDPILLGVEFRKTRPKGHANFRPPEGDGEAPVERYAGSQSLMDYKQTRIAERGDSTSHQRVGASVTEWLPSHSMPRKYVSTPPR